MSRTFHAVDPMTGEALPRAFPVTTPAELEEIIRRAGEAAPAYAALSNEHRAAFLSEAAAQIRAAGEGLVRAAMRETGLPQPRLTGEVTRTANQLELFAELVREGSWVDARIDPGDPARHPLPKPDVRSLRVPLGVVAVFGAVNFPLAFSVAGGDTASALAAGCPVIVKAHPAHPETSRLAAVALRTALHQSALPEGVFQIVYDDGLAVGQALVQHPVVQAVGFTGSRAGGLALQRLAQQRPVPIPVYAEMSSVNPIVLMPSAVARPGLAAGLAGSISGSGGQLCTQPGLLFVPEGQAGDALLLELAAQLSAVAPCVLLTPGIREAYGHGTANLSRSRHVTRLTGQGASDRPVQAQLFQVPIHELAENPGLTHEVFGPSSLAIRYQALAEVEAALESLDGQLTATLHADPAELPALSSLLAAMQRCAGRLILNGYPTGVEVGHAMVHGGPYPATTDPGSTSVGTRAAERFTRLLAFQDFPQSALPPALQNANPLNLWRLTDGRRTREPLPDL